MKNKLYISILILLPIASAAQTPTDALYMNHRQICVATLYQRTQWNTYWEGSTRRDNANIGQVTHQSAMWMGAVGLRPRLNLLATLPYVTTKANKGQLAGQHGVQDLSVWLKYRIIDHSMGSGKLKVFALTGGATPLGKYVPDFMPMSIGLGATTATTRVVADYRQQQGWYLTLRGGHTWRSNVFIDRDAYLYHNQLYYTDEVPLPNVIDAGALLGWRKGPWVSALTFEQSNCLSGDDIRPNDMPFPTNRMNMRAVGLMGKYQSKHWGLTASASRVLTGRNVGQSTALQVGLLYLWQSEPDNR